LVVISVLLSASGDPPYSNAIEAILSLIVLSPMAFVVFFFVQSKLVPKKEKPTKLVGVIENPDSARSTLGLHDPNHEHDIETVFHESPHDSNSIALTALGAGIIVPMPPQAQASPPSQQAQQQQQQSPHQQQFVAFRQGEM